MIQEKNNTVENTSSDKHDTIRDSVLEKITTEHITPTSRWYFKARGAVLWAPGVVVTLLGSFAVAGILFSMVHAGWEYRPFLKSNFIQFLGTVIPLIWVVSLLVFSSLIVSTLRLTSKGYRYKTGIILGVSFLISIILGCIIFVLDMTVMRDSLIRYHSEHTQKLIWTTPLEGRLAGVIEIETNDTPDIDTDDIVVLTDSAGHEWILDVRELGDMSLLRDNASVRMVGEQLENGSFLPCLIFPWDLSPIPRATNRHVRREFINTPPPVITSPYCKTLLENHRRIEKIQKNILP